MPAAVTPMPRPLALRTPALARAARATQGQAAAVAPPSETLALDASTIANVRSQFNAIPKRSNDELVALAAEATQRLATPGLGQEAQGSLWLLRSGALGQLALRKVDRKANGKASYQALRQAVTLAPQDVYVAQAFARSMYAIAERNFFVRKIVAKVLGFDLGQNLRLSCQLLGQFPHDPTSQLVRERIADKIDDKAALAEARGHIARMTQHAPQAMAEARRKLDGDNGLATEAAKDAKDEK